MDYGIYQELKDLLSDSNATEFREKAANYPLNKNRQEFVEWIDSDALPTWGPQYQSMLGSLKSLVGAASDLDYNDAITKIGELVPAPPQADAEIDDLTDAEADSEDEEEIPEPGEAAKSAAQNITAPVIEEFRQQYPDIAARLTPDQLSAMAMKATAAVVGEGGQ